MLIRGLKEILQDQAYIFQDTYFLSSQIHQLTIMHRFEHTNLDILINFLFPYLRKLSLCARNLHQKYLPYLSYCRNLIFQVTMFH